MNTQNSIIRIRGALLVSILALSAGELLAQGTSPWLQAIDVLQQAFTGPIARGLSLIAIVVGGLMFAFGEGGSKKALAGIIFGLGMAMGAAGPIRVCVGGHGCFAGSDLRAAGGDPPNG